MTDREREFEVAEIAREKRDARLFEAWDELNMSAQRAQTALPAHLSEAMDRLEMARVEMSAAVNSFAIARAHLAPDDPCPDCGGYGEIFGHAPDCDNDDCALACGMDDCNGQVEFCHCAAGEGLAAEGAGG